MLIFPSTIYRVFHCLFGHGRVIGHPKRLFRHCIGPVPKTLVIASCRTSNHEQCEDWKVRTAEVVWYVPENLFPLFWRILADGGPQHISRCRAGLDAWPNNFISAHCRLPVFIGFFWINARPVPDPFSPHQIFLKRGTGIWVSTIMLIALLSGFLATYLLGTGLLPPRTSKTCSNSGLS